MYFDGEFQKLTIFLETDTRLATFKDTKWVVRDRKSKSRQYNGRKRKGTKPQMMKDNTLHRKLKIEQHKVYKNSGELMYIIWKRGTGLYISANTLGLNNCCIRWQTIITLSNYVSKVRSFGLIDWLINWLIDWLIDWLIGV